MLMCNVLNHPHIKGRLNVVRVIPTSTDILELELEEAQTLNVTELVRLGTFRHLIAVDTDLEQYTRWRDTYKTVDYLIEANTLVEVTETHVTLATSILKELRRIKRGLLKELEKESPKDYKAYTRH